MTTGQRLDIAVAERGLAPSRARARDAILRGHVRVDGVPVSKPGQDILPNAVIEIDDPASAYVSRAALKLLAGLDHFGIDARNRHAIDVGASTGGFTEVLLERGAQSVLAIDVGHGQMHPRLASDPRVTLREGLNARDLEPGHLGGRAFDLLVSDVSFISVTVALPPVLALAASGTDALILVKPQFEAGREAIGKNGLLRDRSEGERVSHRIRDWLDTQAGWRATGLHPSPISGGDGNDEYLLHGRKS